MWNLTVGGGARSLPTGAVAPLTGAQWIAGRSRTLVGSLGVSLDGLPDQETHNSSPTTDLRGSHPNPQNGLEGLHEYDIPSHQSAWRRWRRKSALVNVPTMIAGEGARGVRRSTRNGLISHFFPPDVTFETVSRTDIAEAVAVSSSVGRRTKH